MRSGIIPLPCPDRSCVSRPRSSRRSRSTSRACPSSEGTDYRLEGRDARLRPRAAQGQGQRLALVPRRVGRRHLPPERLRRRALHARRPADGGRGARDRVPATAEGLTSEPHPPGTGTRLPAVVRGRMSLPMAATASYLLSRRDAEHERLRLQSRVWEPAGRALIADLDLPLGARVLDVGCGSLGWLRVLAERVPDGVVVGTDVDADLLGRAPATPATHAGYDHVRLVEDDLFHSALPAGMFDLVHARFQLAPLGRARRPARRLPPAAQARRRPRDRGARQPHLDLRALRARLPPRSSAASRRPSAAPAATSTRGGACRASSSTTSASRRRRARTCSASSRATPTCACRCSSPRRWSPSCASCSAPTSSTTCSASAAAEIGEPGRAGTTFTLVQSWARVG